MAQSFIVRYFDPGRQAVVEEPAHAGSEQELRDQCTSAGRVVLELRSSPRPMRAIGWGTTRFDVTWWCRELRTLLRQYV